MTESALVPVTIEQAVVEASDPSWRILIVEDNVNNIEMLADYLRAHGHMVHLACDGEQAIRFLRVELPDIVLMDIQMPKLDGWGAIQQIRADPDLAAVPIIAVTALAMQGDRDRCLQAGADAYLSKPFRLREMLATIETCLAEAALSEAL